jgi:PleD family two-component response regulator
MSRAARQDRPGGDSKQPAMSRHANHSAGRIASISNKLLRSFFPNQTYRLNGASQDTGAPVRVLIIEDNETTMGLLRQLVERAETCEVIPFTNPTEAAKEIGELDFDLALIDYAMPEMDGIEVIRAIRRVDKYRSVPIVMVTAENEKATRLEAFNAGATDFLSKPIEPVEFKARVRNLLALRRAQVATGAAAA